MEFVIIGFQILLLFAMYQIGVLLQQFFQLTIPGSVIGLILMFLLLSTGLLKEQYIKKGAAFMIRHLVLFFIPATVGIIKYYDVFKGKGIWLIWITIASTLLVMVLSGMISQLLAKKGEKKHV